MKLSDICAKCGGQCCRPPIFLGKYDLDRLLGAGLKFDYSTNPTAGYELLSDGVCPFLEVGKGCTLEERVKPIDCTVFPLTFTEGENMKFTFYLNTMCPFYSEVPSEWIQKTIKDAREMLKNWTPEERKAYSERHVGKRVKPDSGVVPRSP